MLLKTYFLSSLITFLVGSFLSGTWTITYEALRILLLQASLIMASVSAYQYLRSLPATLFGIIGFLCLTQMSYHKAAWVAVPVYLGLFAGVVLFIKNQGFTFCKNWKKQFVPAVVVACTVLMGSHYYDFGLKERWESLAFHQDTLFHASISEMLKTYNVSSTGLNGLVTLDYHILVHRLVAAVSILTDLPSWITLPLFNLMVIGPGLVCALAFCMIKLSENKISSSLGILLSSLLLSLDKLINLSSVANWDSVFLSESYGLAIALTFIGIPYFFIISKTNERINAALLMGLACLAKISLIPYCVVAVFCGIWHQINKKILAIFIIILCLTIIYLLRDKIASLKLEPLYYATVHNKLYNHELVAFLEAPFSGTASNLFKAFWSACLFTFGNAFPILICLLFYHPKVKNQKFYLASTFLLFLTLIQVKVVGCFYLYNPAYLLALPFFGIYIENFKLQQQTKIIYLLFLICLANSFLAPNSSFNKKSSFVEKKNTDTEKLFFDYIKNFSKKSDSFFFQIQVPEKIKQDIISYTGEASYYFYFPLIKERAFVRLLPEIKSPTLKFYGYDEYYDKNDIIKIKY